MAYINTIKDALGKALSKGLSTANPTPAPVSDTTAQKVKDALGKAAATGLSVAAPVKTAVQPQFDAEAFMAEMNRQNQANLDAYNQMFQNFINTQNQNQSDIESRINALNQAKQAQAISDLGKARDTQLSNLASEETGIKPMYNNQRNAAAANNLIARRTLAEELASRGETRSGVADQANINANMSLQSGLGALNQQEASDISDIVRRKTGIQNAYESDVASAKAGIEAATMQNLIDQYNTDKQFKLQEAGLTGTYNGNQTLDALNSARNYALNEAGLTGVYNGNQTLDALNAARNYALNEAGLTGVYNGSPTLAAQNQAFNQDLSTKQYNQSVTQQKLDNLYRDKTFDYQKSRDAISDAQWQKSLNLDLRQQTFAEAQAEINNAVSKLGLSQDAAAQALQWAQFSAEQDPESLDNKYKQAQIDAVNSETNSSAFPTVDEYAAQIEARYLTTPNSSNGYATAAVDTIGVKKYLNNLLDAGVPDAIVDELAIKYGV